MPREHGAERRHRDIEEILELRRSFGTLGRRLGTRHGPVQPGLAQFRRPSIQDEPDADDRPEGEQPEPEFDQRPEPELDQQPESHEEPEPDQQPGPDQEPNRVPAAPRDVEPVADAQPDGDQDDTDQEPGQEPGQDLQQASTTVRRATPVVDEAYRAKAPWAAAPEEPFRVPEPPAAEPGRRRLWPWLVGIAAVFALGMAVDHAVLQPAPRAAPSVSTAAAPAPVAPPSSVASASPPASVPRSCLITAQRADVLVHLLVEKHRGLEVTKALEAYTLASQTCRKEASSR